MLGQKLKRTFFGTAAAGAMVIGLGVAPAAAVPSFTINPNAIPGSSGFPSATVATDLQGTSDGLIRQIGPSTQQETGWVQLTGMQNNGLPVSFLNSGLFPEDNSGTRPPTGFNTYGMYILFDATVNGITGFGAGQTGTIGPGGFNFTLIADTLDNDIFNAGATSNTGGTPPTVTNTAGDVVIAQGSSLSGSAGFQATSGAPIFSALSSFILCNGTPGQGLQGGVVVAAPNCGTFNATTYFTAPVPFYDLNFASTTAGSALNINAGGTNPPNATLTGIVVDINFPVPEPGSLLLLGSGLLGLAGMRRRRARS